MRFDEKGISFRLSSLSPAYWLVVRIDREEKEPLQFLWVLAQCLLCSRHVRFTQKEQNNNHTHATVRFTRKTFVTSDSRVKRVFDQGDVKVEMHIVTLNTEKDEDILVEEGHGVSEGHMPVWDLPKKHSW